MFTTMGGTVSCKTITYVGSVSGTSTAEVELEPTYSGCTAFGFINVPIDVNTCKFRFTSGEEKGGKFEGSVHLVCLGKTSMEITAPGCTVTVGSQTPTGGTVTYTNIGSGTTRELTIDLALEGVHYIEDNAGKFSTCSSPGVTTTDGKYTGHVLLTDSQNRSDVLTTMGGTVNCTTISYEGSVTGTSTTEAEVAPAYSGCTAFGFVNVPIDVNGCKYKATSGEIKESAYAGSLHIICPAGKAIEITGIGCTVTVGSQTPTGGTITYTNVGFGTTHELTIDLALEGIHYVEDNVGEFPTCSSPGQTTTDGKYTGEIRVTGENGSHEQHGIQIE